MSSRLSTVALPLFVPADRPERFEKAAAAGADAVVIDLEDAVAPDAKGTAREALAGAAARLAALPCAVLVRVNAAGTSHHSEDLRVVARLAVTSVMLPKAETPAEIEATGAMTGHPVLALVETARGLAGARALAESAGRLAFGSIDFAADMGCAHTREALLAARAELVLASRLAGRPAPLDGVTTIYTDPAPVEDDARHAASLGFAGKLLIHPAQVAPARAGFAPSAAEVAWARRVLATASGAAVALDGAMVDLPVRLRAEAIMRRAAPEES